MESRKIRLDLSKENLIKILNILFSKNNGRALISNKNHFINRFESLEKIKDITFWNDVIKIISDDYKITEDKLNNLRSLLKTDFDEFIRTILNLRFNFFFKEGNEENITDYNNLIDNLINKNYIIFEDGNTIKIFKFEKFEEERFIKPYQSEKFFSYPIILIEIDKQNSKIKYSGSKKEINKLRYEIKSQFPELIENKEIKKFKEFDLTLPYFFSYLEKERDLFIITKIYLKRPNFEFLIKTHQDLDTVKEFISQLNNPADFLNLNEMGLLYLAKQQDKKNELKEIYFKLTVEKEKSDSKEAIERYFIIRLHLDKRNAQFRDEIINNLNNVVKINEKYQIPPSYYFNRLILVRENLREMYLKKLLEIDGSNKVIEMLKKEKIIEDDNKTGEVRFNQEEFIKKIAKIFRELTNKAVEINKINFLIVNVKKQKSVIELTVKESQEIEGKPYDYRYSIKIILGRYRSKKYDKLYYILIKDIDFFKVLENYIKNKRENIKYLHKLIEQRLKYFQSILKRSAILSSENIKDLVKLYNSSDKKERKKIGKQIELELNVILRELFGNYIPYGAGNQPDGVLWLSSKEIYLIDPKMHEKIKVSEFRKMKDYLDNFYNEIEIEPQKTRRGVFIISSHITESINHKEKQKQFSDASKYFVGFVTLEFILELFGVYNQHSHIFRSQLEIKNYFVDAFLKFIKKSKDIEDVKGLTKIQKEVIASLKSKIDEISKNYQPQRKLEGI